MTSLTMKLTTTVTAGTKRPPSKASGKRGAMATNLSSLLCTPFYPVDSEIRERFGLNAPMELLQTFVQGGLDIVEGDVLVVSGTEYPIRAVADWEWPPDGLDYLQLVVEELKA